MRSRILHQDLHVHSRLSDGRGTLEDNVLRAEALGLDRLGCVEHVDRASDLVPRLVHAVTRARGWARLDLRAGVEARILSERGELDLPRDLAGVDHLYAADHWFPLGDGCYTPAAIMTLRRSGAIADERLVSALVRAYVNVMRTHRRVTLAHPFRILPRVGLAEDQLTAAQLGALIDAALATGARIEISEKWRCPTARVVSAFARAGVAVVAGSDAHDPSAIGAFRYVRAVAALAEPVAPELLREPAISLIEPLPPTCRSGELPAFRALSRAGAGGNEASASFP